MNLEQRYFRAAFIKYAFQCNSELPNPRILERKGALIRHVFSNENIEQSVNSYIFKEIGQFLDIHDDLMHGIFGQALSTLREIRADRVSDNKILDTPEDFLSAARQIDSYSSKERDDGTLSPGIHPEVAAIVSEIGSEAEELANAIRNTNDPSVRQIRIARLKSTVFHGALLLGRLILRAGGATLSATGSMASLLGIFEIVKPGTVVTVYQMLRTIIPELPPIPPL